MQVAELEARALGELGEMHDELLDLRETCFKLQIALTDSERRRYCSTGLLTLRTVWAWCQYCAGPAMWSAGAKLCSSSQVSIHVHSCR